MTPTLDVRQLLSEPELRFPGGVFVERQPRAGTPTFDGFGEAVLPPATTVLIDPVVIHNMAGKDLRRLVEADRATEHIAGYSLQRVYVSSTKFVADVVRYNDRRWRVDNVQDYEKQGGVFIWAAALIEEGAK